MTVKRIDQTRARATEILRSAGLTPFRQILDGASFAQAWAKPIASKTVLIPEVVFWLMAAVALGEPSMTASVVTFWATVRVSFPWLPLQPVTEEAFCIARGLLPLRFFMTLFNDLIARFHLRFGDACRWKGRRVLGIDGTEVDLPRHARLARLFPATGNQHGAGACPQGRLVGLVGLWNGICYHFRWTSLAVSEQASARRLLQYLLRLDLLLADRNFPDLATFAAILRQAADFLFHLPSNRFLEKSRTVTPSGRAEEWYVRLSLTKALREAYPELAGGLQVRILRYQIDGFRPSWLVTSLLDTQAFPYEELVALYHERWRQETFHREWKYTLQLSGLRSHSATGLLKEVLVQLTMNNAIRWIMAEACTGEERPVALQFLAAKRLILASMPAMTLAPLHWLPMLYEKLRIEIAGQRIRVRPGRSYPRRWDGRARPKGHGRTAQPARMTPTEHVHVR